MGFLAGFITRVANAKAFYTIYHCTRCTVLNSLKAEHALLIREVRAFYDTKRGKDVINVRADVLTYARTYLDSSDNEEHCKQTLPQKIPEYFGTAYKNLADEYFAELKGSVLSKSKARLKFAFDQFERGINRISREIIGRNQLQTTNPDEVAGTAFVGTAAMTGASLAVGSAVMGNLGFYALATTMLSWTGHFSFATYLGLTSGIAAIGGPVVAGLLASLCTGFAVAFPIFVLIAIFRDWRKSLLNALRDALLTPESQRQQIAINSEFVRACARKIIQHLRREVKNAELEINRELQNRETRILEIEPSPGVRLIGCLLGWISYVFRRSYYASLMSNMPTNGGMER